jgi:hypothetical protein
MIVLFQGKKLIQKSFGPGLFSYFLTPAYPVIDVPGLVGRQILSCNIGIAITIRRWVRLSAPPEVIPSKPPMRADLLAGKTVSWLVAQVGQQTTPTYCRSVTKQRCRKEQAYSELLTLNQK